MKKAIKIIGAILVIMLLGVVIYLKTAVGGKSIYISTGFEKNVMIKVDQTVTTRLEVMVHLTDMVREYEELFGADVWSETMNGMTFEQYAIDQVKSKLTRVKCMDQEAMRRGIVLSNQEEANVKKAAAEYVASLEKTSIKKYGVTEAQVQEFFRAMLLSDKLFNDMTYEVDTEISEDEARVISIQYIRTENAQQAVAVKNRLNSGESFAALIKENNPYEFSYELRRGEMEEAFEEAAFNLVTGETSDVVETDMGCYIIMCVNEYDKMKTAANKEQMIQDNKLKMFNQKFEPYEADLYAEYNVDLWNKVTLEDCLQGNSSFSDVYLKYFQ